MLVRRRCCQLKGEAKEGEGEKRERKVRLSAPENKVLISNATVKSALLEGGEQPDPRTMNIPYVPIPPRVTSGPMKSCLCAMSLLEEGRAGETSSPLG